MFEFMIKKNKNDFDRPFLTDYETYKFYAFLKHNIAFNNIHNPTQIYILTIKIYCLVLMFVYSTHVWRKKTRTSHDPATENFIRSPLIHTHRRITWKKFIVFRLVLL